MNKPLVVTVSQVNRRISLMIKGDPSLGDLYVKGEISNFVNHYKSGHFYFTLKDETTSIRAVMFRSNAENIGFIPEDGMKVIIRGSIQVFERDGAYQLYATEMQPDGLGALYLAYEQLKEKLYREGLFERKRPLPANPQRIAIITAETGAAIRDILNILERRCPIVTAILIPSLVQGAEAPKSLVSAIKKAQTVDADLIIIGRGGGSIEDLWAFNDEAVARALFDSEIPTISAVGHETDFTIADFVADLRAPTPSAAAELAVPDMAQVKLWLIEKRAENKSKAERIIEASEKRLEARFALIKAYSPAERIKKSSERLLAYQKQIALQYRTSVEKKESALLSSAALINALSPIGVLLRGYSITEKDGAAVRSAKYVKSGDKLKIRLSDGMISAVAEKTEDIYGNDI